MNRTARRKTPATPVREFIFKAPEDQIAIFEAAQSEMERRVAQTLISIQNAIRDAALDQRVIEAIGQRDWNEALRLMGLGYAGTEADAVDRFLPVVEQLRVGLVDAGQAFAVEIPARLPDGSLGQPGSAAANTRMHFDPLRDTVIQWQRGQRIRLLTELLRTHREVAQLVIADGLTRQEAPVVTARRLRQRIGLTPRQAQAVTNFERMLREGDPAALNRKLRDRRFDPSIRAAISGDRVLSEDKIRAMVDRYYERYRQYRAMTIAQTEATMTANVANQLAWLQAIEDGHIDGGRVVRFWQHLDDARVRNAHLEIPGTNPDGVGLEQDFVTPLGPLRFPGDPRGVAANIVNCRCRVFVTLHGANA